MISYIPINISCCFVIVVDLPLIFFSLLFLCFVDLLSVGCFLFHFLLVFFLLYSFTLHPYKHRQTKTPTQIQHNTTQHNINICCTSTPAATVRSMSLYLKTGEYLFICLFFKPICIYLAMFSVWSCACIYC